MDLKELLDIAKNHLKGMTTIKYPDFRLEQAEYNKSERVWDIVVSYLVEKTNKRKNPLPVITTEFEFHRIYKRLKIDSNKNVVGFYIYNNKE